MKVGASGSFPEIDDRSNACCPDVKIQRFGNAERDQRGADQSCDLF